MNSVILVGNLTRDPEVRQTTSGETVCAFTIAVERPQKEGQQKQTDFPRITVFGKQGDSCGRYLKKGRTVAVQGRLQTGSYTNKNGEKVYTTDVVANRVEFLGGNNDEKDGWD